MNRFTKYVLINTFSVAFIALLVFVLLQEDYNFTFENHHRYQINVEKVDQKLFFANELVPIYNEEVKARFDHELSLVTRKNRSLVLLFKRSNTWFPVIDPILARNKVPGDFKYFAVVESGLQPLVSRKGAAGFWQLMPHTARDYGLEVNDEVDERFHIEKSTEVAAKLIKAYYRKFGSWSEAAAAYNFGAAKLERLMKEQGEDRLYGLEANSETARFFFKILAYKRLFNRPQEYGFLKINRYGNYRTKMQSLRIESSIPDLKAWCKIKNLDPSDLFEHNPWLRKNSLTIKEEGHYYTIKLPVGSNIFAGASLADSVGITAKGNFDGRPSIND